MDEENSLLDDFKKAPQGHFIYKIIRWLLLSIVGVFFLIGLSTLVFVLWILFG